MSETQGDTTRAAGTFDVKVTPQPADDYTDGIALGRMTIEGLSGTMVIINEAGRHSYEFTYSLPVK